VYVRCNTCGGKRYNRETLEIKYRGLSIADALELTVDDAAHTFDAIPRIRQRIDALRAIGLGYLQLGQSATTLSGGEAQRVKLAAELARKSTGSTLYVMDEPTTGLHFSDIEMLLTSLFGLRDAGNTVILIEHNLEVVACSDWVIDMGPLGGSGGGEVVAIGTPEDIAHSAASQTGRYLAPILETAGAAVKSPRKTGAKASRAPARASGGLGDGG
jgi:excinuclease ABC subunit A